MSQGLPSDWESFTETETTDVELNYEHSDLKRILVTVVWKNGTREAMGDGQYSENVSQRRTVDVEYTIDDDVAELTGFYPDTNKTGRELYRRTLDSIRTLKHAYEEVKERVDDDVRVQMPADALMNEL